MRLFVTGSASLLVPGESPGEIKRWEVELDSRSWMVCLAAELFLNSCFSDTVLVTLLRTAVGTAFSEVHKLLLNVVVLAVADDLFILCGPGHLDELFISI